VVKTEDRHNETSQFPFMLSFKTQIEVAVWNLKTSWKENKTIKFRYQELCYSCNMSIENAILNKYIEL